jgi:hypothetical protein
MGRRNDSTVERKGEGEKGNLGRYPMRFSFSVFCFCLVLIYLGAATTTTTTEIKES